MIYRIYVRLIYKNKNFDKPFDVLAMSDKQAKNITINHCKEKFKKAYIKIVECKIKNHET
jgi:hypothetical protein